MTKSCWMILNIIKHGLQEASASPVSAFRNPHLSNQTPRPQDLQTPPVLLCPQIDVPNKKNNNNMGKTNSTVLGWEVCVCVCVCVGYVAQCYVEVPPEFEGYV